MRSSQHLGGRVDHDGVFPKSITGHHLEPYTTGSIDGGILCVFRFELTAAADYDITAPWDFEVIDAWGYNLEAPGGASTATVKNGSTAITNAMDFYNGGSGVDKTVVRAGTIDDAQRAVSKGGTLRVTNSSAHDKIVFVSVLRT